MEPSIRILHLEDNPKDVLLVQSVIERANVKYQYYLADCEKDYFTHLRNKKIDVILSDYNLPGYDGTEALIYAKNNYPHIPFIFVSGTMGEDAAINSLLNGATDYVLKHKMERLVPAIQRAMNEVQELKARLAAEKELRKISSAVEQSANSVIITDPDGTIEYANPATVQLSGYTIEEIIGKNQGIFSSLENQTEGNKLLWKKIKASILWKGEFLNKKKNGELWWEAASFAPVLDVDGTVTNYVAIKEDITERKKLTQELIIAKEKAEESDRLKTAFLNNISHEIRTPLNAIVGFSDFLNDPDLSPYNRKQYTDIITRNSDQLLSIISAIVSIAFIEAGHEKIAETEITLNATLKRLHEQFVIVANKQNITLNLIPFLLYEDSIVSDETKLLQILTNLISNALKFTKQGHINFGYVVKGNDLEFFVEDTGIGIPSEMFGEIFKRFRQVENTTARQYGGSGLGLSISKAYVELLGGKMWVVSELGKGSTFYFTIPYIRGKKNITQEKESGKKSNIETKDTKTVLVAEDEDSNYLLMEALLLNLDINIVRAMNGAEAIQTCKSKHVDVVLMDIKMPVMDGYEATKQIREFLPGLPIIAQTAYASATDKSKAMACGCTDFISKPFKRDLLVSKVTEQLYKR